MHVLQDRRSPAEHDDLDDTLGSRWIGRLSMMLPTLCHGCCSGTTSSRAGQWLCSCLRHEAADVVLCPHADPETSPKDFPYE